MPGAAQPLVVVVDWISSGVHKCDVEYVLDLAGVAVSQRDPAVGVSPGSQQLPRVGFLAGRLEG